MPRAAKKKAAAPKKKGTPPKRDSSSSSSGGSSSSSSSGSSSSSSSSSGCVDRAPVDVRLPVTVLSGFLGAGKTTLLKRILRLAGQSSQEGPDAGKDSQPGKPPRRVAVIVNDMGEVNLDASEIKSSKLIREEASMVELHNGCICCTLRGDLLKTVRDLCEEQVFDYLVIESTGISEPLPVAQTFLMDLDGAQQGLQSLSSIARVDTMVTVVDAVNIYDVLSSLETLSEDNVSGMVGNSGIKAGDGGADGGQAEDCQHGGHGEHGGHGGHEGHCEHGDDREQGGHGGHGAHAGHAGHAEHDEHGGHSGHGGHGGHGSHGEHASHGGQADHVEQGAQGEESDDRSIAMLLMDQIEFANVLLLSKTCQLVERHGEAKGALAIEEIRRLLQKLNPGAKVVVPAQPHFADIPLSEVVNTNLFDLRKALASKGWLQELARSAAGGPGHTPETEEYGISSVVFRSRERPLHLGRLLELLDGFGDYASVVAASKGDGTDARNPPRADGGGPGAFAGVVRAKGQLWVASANSYRVDFHAVGRMVWLQPTDEPYLAAIPQCDWDDNQKMQYEFMKYDGSWHDENGDRESEAVLIGVGLDKARVLAALGAALLTDEEMAGGPSSWRAFEDAVWDGKYFEVGEIKPSHCHGG